MCFYLILDRQRNEERRSSCGDEASAAAAVLLQSPTSATPNATRIDRDRKRKVASAIAAVAKVSIVDIRNNCMAFN